MTSVAVIDIGSNSIKVLVATRTPDGRVTPLKLHTIDARISAGLSQAAPRLSEEGMARGLEAIRSLLADAAHFSPARTLLVATSAVRDAQNGAEFRERIRAATGHEVRILTGDEEANLIGRGLVCDTTLSTLRNFYVFDLGGGSLECLAFRDRKIVQAVSLQLGCVRLTEKFVADPTRPFDAGAGEKIGTHTREIFLKSGFKFSLPTDATAVGTGGTLTTLRAVIGARRNVSFEHTDSRLTLGQLREVLSTLGAMPLAERRHVAGLPPPRADVFPTALATLITVAELGRFEAYQNSVFNLRYGLADELLAT